jgi:hypothetical protein
VPQGGLRSEVGGQVEQFKQATGRSRVRIVTVCPLRRQMRSSRAPVGCTYSIFLQIGRIRYAG